MTRVELLNYLQSKKTYLKETYGITTLGLYGSYARDEATKESDVDIFYERDNSVPLKSGLEFMFLGDKMAEELHVDKVDFVKLSAMNPIIKHYAKEDFIYV
jgi:predicted nucleotidyltransferase